MIVDSCPLCAAGGQALFFSDRRRDYWQCPRCELVHVPKAQRLDRDGELAEYLKHQNSPEDAGYRRFLSRLFLPLNQRLPAHSQGLDFGCGPGPTLSLMFEEQGHSVALYDPFFADRPELLEREYDFVTATEVLEHLHEPGRELTRLWRCLRPGGYLGVMTKRVLSREAFANWHYKNDPTHVCFFSESSFSYLAETLNAELEFPAADVALLRNR